MSEQIIKLLEYLGDKLGMAVDWTQENILPYAQELAERFVTLNIIECALGIVLFIILGIGSVVVFCTVTRAVRKADKEQKDNWLAEYLCGQGMVHVGGCFMIALGICLAIAVVIGIPCCTSELLKWIFIPELQIAEEVALLLQTF